MVSSIYLARPPAAFDLHIVLFHIADVFRCFLNKFLLPPEQSRSVFLLNLCFSATFHYSALVLSGLLRSFRGESRQVYETHSAGACENGLHAPLNMPYDSMAAWSRSEFEFSDEIQQRYAPLLARSQFKLYKPNTLLQRRQLVRSILLRLRPRQHNFSRRLQTPLSPKISIKRGTTITTTTLHR